MQMIKQIRFYKYMVHTVNGRERERERKRERGIEIKEREMDKMRARERMKNRGEKKVLQWRL